MIVQAISLLDDLDKELNNYSMRCREWYGWHFPEMTKIITDNLTYAKTVKLLGNSLVFSCILFISLLFLLFFMYASFYSVRFSVF